MSILSPPTELLTRFAAHFGGAPDFIARAPGRADLIGTHTDYNDGLVLPAAITRNAWVACRARDDRQARILSLDMDAAYTLDLGALEGMRRETQPDWAQYAAGVAWSLAGAGVPLSGCEMAVTGDIPIGAGLSSSAAVEVAYALAWAHLANWTPDPMMLAQLCQRAENAYVGVNSGLMDQFSSVFGQADHVLLFDCRSLKWEAVPLGTEVALVIADTGTRRTLATSRYNERRAECDQALRQLRTVMPEIKALRDVPVSQFAMFKELVSHPARERAKHVIEEIARVKAAAAALKGGDTAALGSLMDESHVSSRDFFAASGPELDAMWDVSKGHPARLGGRFLGAGWAGCLIFLVEAEGADDFSEYTARGYAGRMGRQPELFTARAAQGAEIIAASAGG